MADSPAPGVGDSVDPDVTMDKHASNSYYKLGFINLLSHYRVQRDDNTQLSTWVMDDGQLYDDGQELTEIVAALQIRQN